MDQSLGTGRLSLHTDRGDIVGSSRRNVPHLVYEDLGNLGNETEEVVAPRRERKEPKKARKRAPTDVEYYRALSSMEFSGTRYPHRQTMTALGILRDVGLLFRNCHLTTFMMESFAGYKDETCQFLATLGVTFYDNPQDALDEGYKENEMGFITFDMNNAGYRLALSRIDEVFGFPAGLGTNQDIDDEELQELWDFIATKSGYSSSRSKGSNIRNPAIRYLHKSLASTLFARKVTGNVNEGEMRMMVVALKDLMDVAEHPRVFEGDRAQASLTILLLDQLMGYKEWAERLRRNGQGGELTVGGIVTPILMAAGVELLSPPCEPKWLDIVNLKKQRLLDPMNMEQGHLYHFIHPAIGDATIVLPNPELTRIGMGRNIDFNPPVSALYNPNVEHLQEEPIEPAEDEAEARRFTFEDDPPAKTLKEANRRISLLQKWNQWQEKQFKALKSSFKDLADSVKDITTQLKGKKDKSPTKSPLQRSGSFSVRPQERAPIEPPRSSAVEPRRSISASNTYQRRREKKALPADQEGSSRVALGEQPEPKRPGQTDSMDVDRVSHPEPYLQPTANLHSMDTSRAEHPEPYFQPTDLSHSMNASRANYTESADDMAEAYVNAFFSPP